MTDRATHLRRELTAMRDTVMPPRFDEADLDRAEAYLDRGMLPEAADALVAATVND